MSKFNDNIRYYFLVVGIGLVAASVSVAFYLLYLELWSLTQQALAYSLLMIVPLAFLAIIGPYLVVKTFAKVKTTGSGTHAVLEAYHLTNGEIELKDTLVKSTAAMLTIGLGGSAGPEGPSLLAGGGVTSALTRYFKIHGDMKRRLFIAGAAAGLAATFRTPLTAILFSLEIPYKNDLDRETFIEAIVASVPAYLFSIAVLGSEPFFGEVGNIPITLYEIGLSLALGLICGLYAVFFTKTFSWTEHLSFRLRKSIGNLGLASIGASVLALSGLLSIYTIGVGLDFVGAAIGGTTFSLAVLVVFVLLKTFATATTLNFGGSGGLFFPTIVVGAGLGSIFSSVLGLNYPVMFMAVGMAALLAGTHKVVLTPVAFVVETLGGVFAIPALLASGVSFVLSGKHSFYPLQPRTRLKTEELALERFYLKGEKLIPEKLAHDTLKEFMTKKPVVLHQGTTVKAAVDTFEGTKFRVLPVTDEFAHVVGVVTLEDLGYVDVRRQQMTLSETVMHKPTVVKKGTSLKEVAQLMMETQQDHLFVLDAEERLIGVVAAIDVVKRILELLSSD
ncbi:MAG: chloride channel protein [Candidatus Bathyarchaeota archaeon]|nr:chloride channel protein [Candidatus Bathyarchaeota archaeon]